MSATAGDPQHRPCPGAETAAPGEGCKARCLIPDFNGALLSPAWRDVLSARQLARNQRLRQLRSLRRCLLRRMEPLRQRPKHRQLNHLALLGAGQMNGLWYNAWLKGNAARLPFQEPGRDFVSGGRQLVATDAWYSLKVPISNHALPSLAISMIEVVNIWPT